MLSYPVKLTPDDNTFLVTSPDFPELKTFGETRDDALMYAVGAFSEAIAARIAYREDLPTPSKGQTRVALSTQTALKVLLYQAMRDGKVNKAELARRLHCHGPQVDRLLDLNHASRLDQIDAAFNVVGQRVSVEAVTVQITKKAKTKVKTKKSVKSGVRRARVQAVAA